MSIYKINSGLPTTTKIELLNDMIIELYGLISQGKFDKNEISDLYDQLGSGYPRKFSRDVSLGNTLLTYSNWSDIKDETGYSIWKYSPTSYVYNTNNQFYLDNKILLNKGLASSETATTFDSVIKYDATAEESGETQWTTVSTEAGTENGTEFNVCTETDEYLYVGLSSTFTGIKFEFNTRGSNYTLKIEYFGDDSPAGWKTLTTNVNGLEDGTSNFESDGAISWEAPDDWAVSTVNSVTNKYWIRISTTTEPITTAKAYYIIPANSVISLLALSSSDIFNENWKWCSYSGSVYVTLRNAGNPAYEGNYYITSSSSTTNKQNFFIYNHTFTADYSTS